MIDRAVLAALALCAQLALASFAAAQGNAPPNVAGRVDFIEGPVTLQKPDKTRVTPKVGDAVYEGDALATGAEGEVHVTMQDGGYIALRPETKMSITHYQASGEASDRSVLDIIEGSLRSVTGWIGKFNSKSYQIRAGLATVGIRGTDHETLVRLKDDAEGGAGVYDRVYEGGTFISSPQGRVDVTPNRVGFHPAGKTERPRLLDRVPRFFRATRNERRIEGRHARIQPLLEKLREQRRTRLKEPAAGARAKREGAAAEKQAAKAAEQRKQAQLKAKEAREAKAKAEREAKKGSHQHEKAKHPPAGKAPEGE